MLNWTTEDKYNSTDHTEGHEFYPWSIVGASAGVLAAGVAASSYDINILRREKWQNFHIYLLSISGIDLVSILLDFPGFILVSVLNTGYPWPLGKPMCFFWLYIDWFTSSFNILIVMAVHLEYYFSRYCKDNAAGKKFNRQAVFYVFLTWVVASTLSLPVLILFSQQEFIAIFFCAFNHFDSLWLLPYFIGGCILPLIVVVCYDIHLLSQLIRERSYFERKPSMINKIIFSPVISTSSSQVQFFEPDSEPKPNIVVTVVSPENKCNRRKIVIILGFIFLLCYGPWSVCCLLSHWVPDAQGHTLLTVLYWPIMLFPIIHPIALCFCHQRKHCR